MRLQRIRYLLVLLLVADNDSVDVKFYCLLDEQIGKTGGLSGMGTRSMLQTVQTVLQAANTVVMPFWNIGFLFVAIQWARNRKAQTKDLLTGFLRCGPYLRLSILKILLMILVLVICANLSSILFMLTPAYENMLSLMGVTDTTALLMDMDSFYTSLETMSLETQQALLHSMIPLVVIWAVISLVLLVPVLYRLRMAEFLILDHPGMGALEALARSMRMTYRRVLRLLRLDLHFWWYYVLSFLCAVISYGEVFLGLAGVELPVPAITLSFATYILYIVSYFALQTLSRPKVATAYAALYDILLQVEPEKKPAKPQPQNVPWDA